MYLKPLEMFQRLLQYTKSHGKLGDLQLTKACNQMAKVNPKDINPIAIEAMLIGGSGAMFEALYTFQTYDALQKNRLR
jgi:hypothetical protein